MQIVQVDRLSAAQRPAGANKHSSLILSEQKLKDGDAGSLTSNSCARSAPGRCGSVYQWTSACPASWGMWETDSCSLSSAPLVEHWHRWPANTQTGQHNDEPVMLEHTSANAYLCNPNRFSLSVNNSQTGLV